MLVQDVVKKIQDDIASLNRRLSSISIGAGIDHGGLSGLADDDHVQYLLADGSRNLSSYIDIDEIADPGAPAAGDVRFFAHDEHLISLGEDDMWYDLSSGAFSASSHIHAAITVTDEGGLNITWSAGEIFDAFISGANQMVDIAAEPVNQAQTANTMNWLFYDQTAGGLDNSANEDDIKWNEGDFPVAAIGCSPTDILALHHFPLGNRELHNIKRVLFTALNAVVSDGLVISEHAGGGAFDVDLSAGTFVHLGIDVHNTSAIDSTVTNIIRWFHDAADNWATDTNAQIDAANWDDPTDGAGIQPNTNNKYYRSIFYTDGTYIHWLYPQEEFDTLAQAIAGDDPEPPDYLAHFPSCTVIIMKGDDAAFPAAGSDQWIDVRPTLAGAKIGGVVTDHGGLSGLGDDDHTQYLLVSGARAMAGNLDMGGNQITNVGNVDGVDVSAHAARHELGGADQVDHDALLNFVANEHIDHTSVTLTAGTGLTGGGDISANRTFDVDVGIADDKIVQIDSASVADNDYAKFTASGLEGRSYAEMLADLSGQAGAAFNWNNQDLTGIEKVYLGSYFLDGVGDHIKTSFGVLCRDVQNQGFFISGGNLYNDGARIHLAGSTHPTTPSRLTLQAAGNVFINIGYLLLQNIRSGATQAAAGAAADELWKTNGHATLPDNVVMIGV